MNVLRNAAAPGGRTRGEAVNNQPGGLPHTIPSHTDDRADDTATALPAFTPEDAAAVAGGAFVVVVQLEEDRRRRRVFLTLAAAEKVAANARDRGHEAHVLLAHVLPLGVVTP